VSPALHRHADYVRRVAVLSRHIRRKYLELREGVHIRLNVCSTLLVFGDVGATHHPAIPHIAGAVDLNIHHRSAQRTAAGCRAFTARRVTCAGYERYKLPELATIERRAFN